MTIAFVNSGAIAAGVTTLTVAHPATVSAGNLLLMFVGQKPSTANGGTCTTPAGWTLLTSHLAQGGYGATLAADTGNTNLYVFYKVAVGTESSTSISVSLGTDNASWAIILNYSKTTFAWDLASTTGQSTTTPVTPISITTASNPGITTGDHLVTAFCIPTDVTTPSQFTSETLTATGATISASTEIGEPDSTTGNYIGGVLSRNNCTAGTSTAAPVWGAAITGTLTNLRGPLILVRIREASGQAGATDNAVPTDAVALAIGDAYSDNATPTDSIVITRGEAFEDVAAPTDSALVTTRPKISTLVDNFATQDTAKWTGFGSTAVSGGQLVCSATFNSITSLATYDATESGIYVEVPTSAGSARISIRTSVGDRLVAFEESGQLFFQTNTNGSFTSSDNLTYNATTHRWWRLRVSNNQRFGYLDTAPDGTTWTNRFTVLINPTGNYATTAQATLGSGAAVGAVFDNFNTNSGTDYTQTPTDNAVPTDAVALTIGDVYSDNAVPTDAIVIARTEAFEDVAAPTDSSVAAQGKAPSDNAAPTDSIATLFAQGRSFEDPATPTDAAVFALAKVVEDGAGVTDSAAVDKSGAGTLDVTDNAAPTDTTALARAQAASDNAVPTDSGVLAQGKAASDNATPTDSAVVAQGWAVTASDNAAPTDSATVDKSLTATATDNAGPTDSVALAQGEAATDNAVPTDAVVLVQGKAVEDPAAPTDTVTFVRSLVALDDTGSTDSASVSKSGSGAVDQTDLTGSTDAFAMALSKGITDLLGPTDQVVRGATAADVAGVSDSVALSLAISASDSAGLGDNAAVASSGGFARTDDAGLSDAAALAKSTAVSDNANPSDTASVLNGRAVTREDAAGATDAALVVLRVEILATDSAGPTEQVTAAYSLVVVDTEGVTEVSGVVNGLLRDVTLKAVLAAQTRVRATLGPDTHISVTLGGRRINATLGVQP